MPLLFIHFRSCHLFAWMNVKNTRYIYLKGNTYFTGSFLKQRATYIDSTSVVYVVMSVLMFFFIQGESSLFMMILHACVVGWKKISEEMWINWSFYIHDIIAFVNIWNTNSITTYVPFQTSFCSATVTTLTYQSHYKTYSNIIYNQN